HGPLGRFALAHPRLRLVHAAARAPEVVDGYARGDAGEVARLREDEVLVRRRLAGAGARDAREVGEADRRNRVAVDAAADPLRAEEEPRVVGGLRRADAVPVGLRLEPRHLHGRVLAESELQRI